MIRFQSLTKDELAELLVPLSWVRRCANEEERADKARRQARYRARQLFQWVYRRGVDDWDAMTDISKDLRAWLREHVEIARLTEQIGTKAAEDGTHKFLWSLADGKTIESVVIPAALQSDDTEESPGASPGDRDEVGEKYVGASTDAELGSERWGRLTACISSQVGCAMACKFCLTGVQGLDRHLETHEIVAQVHELRRRAPITNIVFMGMGEPLHNLDHVAKACQILIDADGLGFSKRKVTVSTSGIAPAIEELGRRVDVSLAVSLNASHDEQRSAIMPVNRKWNIDRLLEACRAYPLGAHRRVTFEYVLLKDFNDSLEDAARVGAIVRRVPSKINLIPFNEHPAAEFKRPSDETVRAFQRHLLDRGHVATVRVSRGRDILAACGQLRSILGTARGTERHLDWALTTAARTPDSAGRTPSASRASSGTGTGAPRGRDPGARPRTAHLRS